MTAGPSSSGSASWSGAGSTEQASIREIARALVGAWRGMAEAKVTLVSLGLADAAICVGRMLAAAILISVAGLFAWLLSVGLAIMWAVENGFNGYVVTLIAIGLHLAAAIAGVVYITRARRTLGVQLVRHLPPW